MRHESGLPNFNLQVYNASTTSQQDFKQIIENSPLFWPPEEFNTTRYYHAISRGYILNEIFFQAVSFFN